MNNTLKTFFRLSLGVLAIVFTVVLIFVFFQNVINIDNLQVLKWVPLLICSIGFYIAGLINRTTKLAFTPFLFLSLLVFVPLEIFYFPLLYLMILCSSLSLLISRKEFNWRIKIPSLLILIILFGYYLFSQPLIIREDHFGSDTSKNLYNATVIWDFSDEPSTSLPNEEFNDINGNRVSLKVFKGKILYITFWATWCGPCLEEKPELEKLKKKFQENTDIVFVDISVDSNMKKWKTYVTEHKLTGIQLVTRNSGFTRSNFQFSGIPFHVIANSEGYFKSCTGPYSFHDDMLSSSDKLTNYMNTRYKVFKTTKINGKDTIIRIQ